MRERQVMLGAVSDLTSHQHALREPSSEDPVVEVRELGKRYGEVVALDGLGFALARGTITGMLGPNGAGKTTTLRLLLGLAMPTAGSATVFGKAYRDLDRPSCQVGAVLESGDFDGGRTGRNHLRALALAADHHPDRVEQVLDVVELLKAADRPVRTYSLGMRQRLGLAGALLGEPQLLILDEPGNGLDPAGIHWLRTFLRSFAQDGGTVLVCSHTLAEVAQTVDSVLILNRGRLVAERRMAELPDTAALEALYLEMTA